MSRSERHELLSDRLVDAAKSLKVLSAISWPQAVAETFLETWRRGEPELPTIREATVQDAGRVLAELHRDCDQADPVEAFIGRTADSYRRMADLLERVGTPEFHRISREVYGGPDGTLPGSTFDHRAAAEQLLTSTEALAAATRTGESAYCIPATSVAESLHADWDGFFEKPIAIVIDGNLSAKAAASANRVRLRAGTCFSEHDVQQLSAHEIGVHSLTSRNGRRQTSVRALGLGAPRTTATQEGIATFAELVTGAIDMARLRRIALRIRAISMAEDGADFIQLFEHLVDVGEPPNEAVRTTMRVFRGGDVKGRWVFTKDVVYLKGLFAVHTFLRKAISEHRPELVQRLFVGRLTLSDVSALEEAFESEIDLPHYMPKWASNLPSLAAFLAVSAIVDRVDLSAVDLDDV